MDRHLRSVKNGDGCRDGGLRRHQPVHPRGLGDSRGTGPGAPSGHYLDFESVLCPRLALLACAVASGTCLLLPPQGVNLSSVWLEGELGLYFFESLSTNPPFKSPQLLFSEVSGALSCQPLWAQR